MSSELKQFQKNTVAAVLEAWKGEMGTRRYLVADEVGLGKTMVARGVIAALMKERRGSLRVFYLASGGRIGSQNAGRLMPDGNATPSAVDRLGLMHQQDGQTKGGLQLFTLTPETSFRIRGPGAWKERAFLRALLRTRIGNEFTRAECRQLERENPFHGSMNEEKFEREAKSYTKTYQPSDALSDNFAKVLNRRYGTSPYFGLVAYAKGHRVRVLALLRRALAEAELRANAPDVLICDEFQKYRELLLGNAAPTAEHEMMQTLLAGRVGKKTRVLLLSATPFRLYAERWQEALEPEGSRELFDLLEFLGGAESATQAKQLFSRFNRALRRFAAASDEAAPALREEVELSKVALEQNLRPFLCRTERPQNEIGIPFTGGKEEPLQTQDFSAFQHVARVLGADKGAHDSAGRHRLDAVPYWSSVPLAAQTLGMGYVAWKRAWEEGMLTAVKPGPMLRKVSSVGRHRALTAHPKLRQLQRIHPPAASTLPWVAPSLPWWNLGSSWTKTAENEGGGSPEKLLLFSRFRAAPQSIAALTSLAVERAISRRGASGKKASALKAGAKSMGTFTLFHPSPWLIRYADPLVAAGDTWKEIVNRVKGQVRIALKGCGVEIVAKLPRRSLWKVVAGLEKRCRMDDVVREGWQKLPRRTAQGAAEDTSLTVIQAVARWQAEAADVSAVTNRELTGLAILALEAPGIVAGRALFRHDDGVLLERFEGVVSLCWHGLANYLGDPVFRGGTGARGTVQQQLRDWVRDGCLESVLDEHLAYAQGAPGTHKDAAELLEQSLRVHAGSATFYPAGPNGGREKFRVRCHAAVPFGGNEYDEDGSGSKPSRSDELRVAFNSPFRPFLLATTSVGQEGLDFHPWCSQVAHWDLCSSPLDLEQREGRVQRYLGLAGRRQLADRYGSQALKLGQMALHKSSPWSAILKWAETEANDDGGLSPWWVTPGSKIKSHVFAMQHSRDHRRYERLRMLRTLYRLALGQPNQEDLLDSLGQASRERQQDLATLTLKLAPAITSG